MNLKHFKKYSKQDLLSLTRLRKFETKLGERVATVKDGMELSKALGELSSNYVVLGVPEDIGVLANQGVSGTGTAWLSFLQSFLNIQSNDFLEGSELAVLGYFDFSDLQNLIDQNAH